MDTAPITPQPQAGPPVAETPPPPILPAAPVGGPVVIPAHHRTVLSLFFSAIVATLTIWGGVLVYANYLNEPEYSAHSSFHRLRIRTNPTPGVIVLPLPKCYIGGCSGQLCSDQPGAISTCEYRDEYACYKMAKCARQVNGQCGWTQTPQLTFCLSGNSLPF